MKINPQRIGPALMNVSHALTGSGGISAIQGASGNLVTYTVLSGFFIGLLGHFLTELFNNNPPQKEQPCPPPPQFSPGS